MDPAGRQAARPTSLHHHENVVKSAQHHRLAPGALPHDVLDEILNHTLAVAKKRNMVSFVNYASDLFQVEVSHLYDPKTMQFTLIVHIPLVSNTNLLELYEFLPLPIHFNFSANISITPDVGQARTTSRHPTKHDGRGCKRRFHRSSCGEAICNH